ncbi:FadR family transcriptional regulator [Halieaceae bacterium IMCC8485]|uniref:FadR family transcriptional regulator n=1 Tax=Candidatus Seongchinamella marina TaxID=2518990 RepID=A0ABT3SSU5_9GAMM|nr:FadR family transcriptional regulator [Candidatus Seongchinamella marina]
MAGGVVKVNSPIQAVKVRRLYLQVAEQLQQLIDNGSFSVGSRLPAERDLAGQFAVSRPTIREAMIALEIAGLVEVRSGSGVYVLDRATSAQLPQTQAPGPFEILEARKLIESETCALAARHINAQQLTELKSLLSAMEGQEQSVEEAEVIDEQFHCTIAEASGNGALSVTVEWLWRLRNESEISTRFHQRIREEGSRPIVSDHQRIFAALESSDPAAASQAMSDHLQRVIDSLLDSEE